MIDKDHAGHNRLGRGSGCRCWWYRHRDSELLYKYVSPGVFQSTFHNLSSVSSICSLSSFQTLLSLHFYCDYLILILQYPKSIKSLTTVMDKKDSTKQSNGTVAASDLAQYQARWEQIHNDTIRQIQQARGSLSPSPS